VSLFSFCYLLPAEYIERISLTHLSCSSIFCFLSLSLSLVLYSRFNCPGEQTKCSNEKNKTYVARTRESTVFDIHVAFSCFVLVDFIIRSNDREKEKKCRETTLLKISSSRNSSNRIIHLSPLDVSCSTCNYIYIDIRIDFINEL